jgi:5'-nucleotidase
LRLPLRIRSLSPRRFAVNGTPTDAVLLAVQHIMAERKPDIVLSGVNRGGNLGEDVTYSGTIAAAMEGTLLGVPSIALSQCTTSGEKTRWTPAEQHAPELIRKLVSVRWPKGVMMNVNFPDLPAERVGGIAVTAQGRRKIGGELERRLDPRGTPYYWISTMRTEEPSLAGSDLAAVNGGAISVTPLSLDLTHKPTMRALKAVFG